MTTYRSFFRISATLALGIHLLPLASADADILYDNLHILDDCAEGPSGCWTSVLGPDRRYAQQFQMGDNTIIDEVTVQLLRTGPNVSGSLSIELWRDDGQDDPYQPDNANRLVAVLGAIDDVSQMPTERTDFTFDRQVSDLSPNHPYWVVVNFDGLEEPLSTFNSIGWGHTIWPLPPGVQESNEFMETEGRAGTNGASPGHLIREPYGSGAWIEIGDLFQGQGFGTDAGHFVMSVKSSAGPILGDLNNDGRLSADDVDLLATQLNRGDLRFDLNVDGVVDAGDHTYWVHHSGISNTYFGDANLDGEFNSSDLTVVFQAGKYELQEAAGWAEGDWNGDQRFDSSDMIAAFQDGGYDLGPRSIAAVVPEPSAIAMIALGAFALIRVRHQV